MEITSLKLLNFRNFDNLELNFSDTRNIIIGNNGLSGDRSHVVISQKHHPENTL